MNNHVDFNKLLDELGEVWHNLKPGPQCPLDGVLKDYVYEDTSDETDQYIEKHIGVCERCRVMVLKFKGEKLEWEIALTQDPAFTEEETMLSDGISSAEASRKNINERVGYRRDERKKNILSYLMEMQCADDYALLRTAGSFTKSGTETFKNVVEIDINPGEWKGFFASLEEDIRYELSGLVRSDPIRGRFCYSGVKILDELKTELIEPSSLNPDVVQSSIGELADIANCAAIIIGWTNARYEEALRAAVSEITSKLSKNQIPDLNRVEESRNKIRWILYTFV